MPAPETASRITAGSQIPAARGGQAIGSIPRSPGDDPPHDPDTPPDSDAENADVAPPHALIEQPKSVAGHLTPALIRDRFAAKLDEANTATSGSPIANALLQGALSIGGPIGAAISGALSGRAAQLAEKNSERLFLTVGNYVRRLDETKIDHQFLDSEEFTSLLIDILTTNAKTYEQEKTDLFSRIFINTALRDPIATPYKEGFVRIVGDLSTDHIRVFQLTYKRTKNPDPKEPTETAGRVLGSEIASATGLPEHRAIAYGYELVRYGVLEDWGLGRFDYKPGAFALTEYGDEFAAFLRDPLEEYGADH